MEQAGQSRELRSFDSQPGASAGAGRSERPVPDRSAGRSTQSARDFAAIKEQQLVFLLTRQLVDAQIVRAEARRTNALWQEVAALEIDPERITALIYGVADHADHAEMAAVDRRFLEASQIRHGFWTLWGRRSPARSPRSVAGRRGARSAAPRAHLPAR